MDTQTAYRILGLSANATRQEAKKAYRMLAKRHHPDHFAWDTARARSAEERMKQINQAYRLLMPLLKSAPEPPATETSETETSETEAAAPDAPESDDKPEKPTRHHARFFSDMVTRVRASFRNVSRKSGAKRSGGKKTRPAAAQFSRRKRPGGRGPASGQGYRRPAPDFDEVLEPLFSGPGKRSGSHGTGTRPGNRNKKPPRRSQAYENFIRHMALKKRVAARTRLHDQVSAGRVEKISRVRPVQPVGRD